MRAVAHAAQVRSAEVRLLYEQLTSALTATIVNALILIAVLWKEISQPLLLGWFLIVFLLALGRYGHCRTYLRTPLEKADPRRWGRQYLYGVAVNSLLWGFAGFFFFTPLSYVHQVFLAFVLMGMVTGAVSTLSPVRGAYLIFMVPTLLPYGVHLAIAGGELHMAMAVMLVVYVIMMGVISQRLHSTVAESLRLRFANVDLVDDLTRAKEQQEFANRELASQIAEKHSAQAELQTAYADLERRVDERTAKLSKSEEALRVADRRKDEFLAMLGHELRNPLAPIRNALEVIQRPGVPENLTKWGHDIIGSRATISRGSWMTCSMFPGSCTARSSCRRRRSISRLLFIRPRKAAVH